ncbi:MAG TPA: alpha/beta hydrolase, partial [Anaerolineae bacterium]
LRPNRQKGRQQLAMVVAHPERLSEAYLDLSYAAATLPGARRAWLSMLERVIGPFRDDSALTYGLRPELPRLRCPTLFAWGERDGVCSPEWGKPLCDLIPQARLEILPDAGHMPWLDSPQEVAALGLAFLLGRM